MVTYFPKDKDVWSLIDNVAIFDEKFLYGIEAAHHNNSLRPQYQAVHIAILLT